MIKPTVPDFPVKGDNFVTLGQIWVLPLKGQPDVRVGIFEVISEDDCEHSDSDPERRARRVER